MATSTTAPPFPSRPYASGLGRNTPFNNPQPGSFGAPPAQQSSGTYGGTGFGGGGNALGGGSAAATQQQREAQRLERERAERADRERREADERVALDALSEEQREEVNEAVRIALRSAKKGRLHNTDPDLTSSRSSTSTKTPTLIITSSKWP